MSELSELDFTDLYVRLDERVPARYSPFPRDGQTLQGNFEVPDEYEEDVNLLRMILTKHQLRNFSITHGEMRLRACRKAVFGGEEWVAMRRFPKELPDLDQLGFRQEQLKAFRAWGRRSGLIVIGGATRAGKTTTAVGLLVDYLRTHGRTAITIEDPVEYMIQGEVGDRGFCYQNEVHEEDEWGEAVKDALRWAPRYIFLGEVRTAKAARNLLRAATSGHLVICTVHGGSVEETLGALIQIALPELGDTAYNLLADGLCAVVHQSIVQGRPNVFSLGTSDSAGDPVRSAIRGQKLQTLGTFVQQQEALRKQGNVGAAVPVGGGVDQPQQRPAAAQSRTVVPVSKKKSWWG